MLIINLFKMEKEECIQYLAKLEQTDKLAYELRKEFPKYVKGDFVDKFTLLQDLSKVWNGKRSWED